MNSIRCNHQEHSVFECPKCSHQFCNQCLIKNIKQKYQNLINCEKDKIQFRFHSVDQVRKDCDNIIQKIENDALKAKKQIQSQIKDTLKKLPFMSTKHETDQKLRHIRFDLLQAKRDSTKKQVDKVRRYRFSGGTMLKYISVWQEAERNMNLRLVKLDSLITEIYKLEEYHPLLYKKNVYTNTFNLSSFHYYEKNALKVQDIYKNFQKCQTDDNILDIVNKKIDKIIADQKEIDVFALLTDKIWKYNLQEKKMYQIVVPPLLLIMGICRIGKELFLTGGNDKAENVSNCLLVVNLNKLSGRFKSPMIIPKKMHCSLAYKDRSTKNKYIVTLLGMAPLKGGPLVPSYEMEIYNSNKDEWKLGPTITSLYFEGSTACLVEGRWIYTFRKTIKRIDMLVLTENASSAVWEEITPSEPADFGYFSGCFEYKPNEVIIFGGNNDVNYSFNTKSATIKKLNNTSKLSGKVFYDTKPMIYGEDLHLLDLSGLCLLTYHITKDEWEETIIKGQVMDAGRVQMIEE